MGRKQESATADNRQDPRIAMGETVTISFDAGAIVGPGQNISAQGVFFIAPASIEVSVRIAGSPTVVRGELVRMETMGDGKVGIAVRFLENEPK